MPTIAVFDSVDTWQLVINTATSILAFLLVALLQNSERRKDEATHAKLNALAAGLSALMRHAADGDETALRHHERELRASVGLEERI
jgi:low affinity Fe/Cu permease